MTIKVREGGVPNFNSLRPLLRTRRLGGELPLTGTPTAEVASMQRRRRDRF